MDDSAIELQLGDITSLAVDAVVNSAKNILSLIFNLIKPLSGDTAGKGFSCCYALGKSSSGLR